MKIQIRSIQIIYEDRRVSTRYSVLSDDDKEIARDVRDTTLSDALQAAVMAETQAEMDADVAALAVETTDVGAVRTAMLKTGQARTDEAAARERIRQVEAASSARLAAMAEQATVLQKQIDEANARLAQASLAIEEDEVTKP